jgi:hypothetical protein
MPSKNGLDPAWNNYLLTRDCLRVAQRVAKSRDTRLLTGTRLQGERDPASAIEASQGRSDEFVIVALWAEFERFLITYLQERSRAIANRRPKALSSALQRLLEDEIEGWRLDDILDVFKVIVGGQRMGDAKNVKKFRDWVAHKNPKKPPPAKIDPQTAYTLLSGIIADIRMAR